MGNALDVGNAFANHGPYLSTIVRVSPGEAWTLFLTLLLGLIFAVLGSGSTSAADAIERTIERR